MKQLFSFFAFVILIFTVYAYSQPYRKDQSSSAHRETSLFYSKPPIEQESSSFSSDSSNGDNPHVVLKGNVPFFEFPHLQQQSDSIWTFIKTTLTLSRITPPPIIYFSAFDKQKQDKELTNWQSQWVEKNPFIWLEYTKHNKLNPTTITPEWIREFTKHSLPFPKHFIAFHYDGTNRIQINPKRAFLSYYQNDPYGVKKDMVGLGFYIMGHEMLHYAFQEKNILPSENHHCLFTLPLLPNKASVLEILSSFLVARQFSSSAVKMLGLQREEKLQPCKDIKEENLSSLQETTTFKLKDALVEF